jgi:outer membrane protein assembly factor BamB
MKISCFSNDVGDVTAIDLDQQVITWTKNILSQNSISNNLVFKISNILIDKKDVFVSSNSGDLFNLNLETGETNGLKNYHLFKIILAQINIYLF